MSAHAATAEHTIVAPVDAQPPAPAPARRAWPRALNDARATAAGTVAIAGLLCLATFLAGGGLSLATMTTLELILTLLGGAIVAAVVLTRPREATAYGSWSIGLLLAFTALTVVSVVWSVAPDASWQDAGRMLSYSAVLAAAAALAWALPGGWRALLGGIVLAATVVCVYALLTKVLPDHLDANDQFARLQEPYGYWNAIGLTAAMGAIGCLWLGARRSGHALLTALAYPALGLMLVTLLLAYSRGALVALLCGVLVWMALVPLRLRGVRVLVVAGLVAAPVIAWDFSKSALKDEAVGLAARTGAGHQFGVLLAAMAIVLALAGVAIGFFGDRRAPRSGARQAAGYAIAALVVLALIGAVAGLAATKRGLTGTISHDLSSLTNPNAKVPANTAGRLTAIGSVRARYWKEALEIFQAHPALGAGAAGYETARLRYRTIPIDVRQAHGYVVQTLADLGIVGIALSLVLLIAWMAAAGRPTHPFNRRWQLRWPKRGDEPEADVSRLRSPPALAWRRQPLAYTPERIGLLSTLAIVVTFGVHSFVDWTWYVPGNALVALLCAGWLAGRGPLAAGDPSAPAGSSAAALAPIAALGGDADGVADFHASETIGETTDRRRPPRAAGAPLRIGVALVVVAVALLAAWTEWQPQRSVEASEQALALLRRSPVAALSAAQAGVERDPLSAAALFRLAAVQNATGQTAMARATLQKAVRLQPSNPETWTTLGEYDLHGNPRAAAQELRAAVYLNPQSISAQNAYVEALRAAKSAPAGNAPATSKTAGRAPRARPAARAGRAFQ